MAVVAVVFAAFATRPALNGSTISTVVICYVQASPAALECIVHCVGNATTASVKRDEYAVKEEEREGGYVELNI